MTIMHSKKHSVNKHVHVFKLLYYSYFFLLLERFLFTLMIFEVAKPNNLLDGVAADKIGNNFIYF